MKKLTVDGITFETTKEAKAAERELEAIEKIRGRMDVSNPVYAKVLYEKLIEKEMLHTKVGDKFLAELQKCYDPDGAAAAEAAAGENGAGETAAEAKEADTEMTVAETAEKETVTNAADEAEMAEAWAIMPGENEGNDEAEDGVADRMTDVADEEAPTSLNRDRSGKMEEEPILYPDEPEEPHAELSDTGKLEGILNGAIFDEKDLVSFMEDFDGAEEDHTHFGSEEEEQQEEYFGVTGLDALVEEMDEKEAAGTAVEEQSAVPGAAWSDDNEPDDGDTEDGETDLEALMRDFDETEPSDREQELSADLSSAAAATNAPVDGGFHLELEEEEPDDDTLLAQARTLQKELHQEDLSEVFSDRDEVQEKKHFSLYGVLIVSIVLNVVLIASMAIMVQVFRNSDNRNILNYERILGQEYQVATPSDAEEADDLAD